MQAQFICLSVNLLQLLEHEIDQQGIRNTPEEQRWVARLKLVSEVAATANTVLPRTLRLMQQITQDSVKFIRWVSCPALESHPLAASLCSPRGPLRQVMNSQLWTPLRT